MKEYIKKPGKDVGIPKLVKAEQWFQVHSRIDSETKEEHYYLGISREHFSTKENRDVQCAMCKHDFYEHGYHKKTNIIVCPTSWLVDDGSCEYIVTNSDFVKDYFVHEPKLEIGFDDSGYSETPADAPCPNLNCRCYSGIDLSSKPIELPIHNHLPIATTETKLHAEIKELRYKVENRNRENELLKSDIAQQNDRHDELLDEKNDALSVKERMLTQLNNFKEQLIDFLKVQE